MNKHDRKQVDEWIEIVDEASKALSAVPEDLETLADEEQGKYDNMTEGLQESDSGQRILTAAEALSEAHSAVEEANEALDTALEKLQEANDA